MADINPSTENVRAMLTETLGRLRKASEEYFGLLEKGLSSSPLPIADQAKQFCNFMQRNVTATFDLGDKLSQAKDMQEALKTAVRVLPGPNADDDRSGQEHGRVRHEGSDRGLYPKELSHVVIAWGARPPHARAPWLADAPRASNWRRSLLRYFRSPRQPAKMPATHHRAPEAISAPTAAKR